MGNNWETILTANISSMGTGLETCARDIIKCNKESNALAFLNLCNVKMNVVCFYKDNA